LHTFPPVRIERDPTTFTRRRPALFLLDYISKSKSSGIVQCATTLPWIIFNIIHVY
jgi:hypothetical protein